MNGTASSPARRIVSNRASGSLSGEPWCGMPLSISRSDVDSSISPIEAETGRRRSRSSRVITPGFRWGRSPASERTRSAMRARYSIVVPQPSPASSSRAAR